MNPNRLQRLASLSALVILALPALAAAAEPAKPAPPPSSDDTFFEVMEVNVVNVDVYVTDRQGKPVKGLTKDDFVVYEDGKPIEISNFYAADDQTLTAEGATAEPGAAAAPAARQVPPEQQLHLAIYIDNRNLTPRARNEALKAVRGFLGSQPQAGNQLLVVTYSGPGSLNIEQAATSDPGAVIQKLEQVATSAATGSFAQMDRQSIVRDIERAPDPNSSDPRTADMGREEARNIFSQIQVYGQQRYNETKGGLNTFGQFIDSLAGLPGRKAVLYISGGVSMRPVQALYDSWSLRYGSIEQELGVGSARLEGFSTDLTTLYGKLAARANASRVTLYSLGTSEDMNVNSAENGSTDFWGSEQATQESSNRAESMLLLASSTGGLASVNSANYGVMLDRLRSDIDSYYSLGYSPSQRKTGKDHKIKVETRDKSYRLRYRSSYRDRTAQERLGEQTLSALLIGQQDNPLNLALEFEGESRPKKDQMQVTLLIKFPMAGLVLLPQENFHEGRVTLFVGARDQEGRVSDLTQIAIPIRVPNSDVLTAMGQTVAYRTNLVLRAQAHTVAIGMRDELGNVGSTVTASYTPGQAPPAQSASTSP
ncbi:MAG TPA: VWA domain-containing protein [Thermoanaerobaculia bacterium]|nr:VWA domain-containing protein [Thermoanaerobaculia bacterium]